MFIVCKIRENGSLVAGTPPTVHSSYDVAKAESERLAASVADATAFVIFEAVARSERVSMPVKTFSLRC